MALGLTVVFAATAAGSAVKPVAAAPARKPHHSVAAPQQQWANASGQSHLAGSGGNEHVPMSQRGRYPLKSYPVGTGNNARVLPAQVSARQSFDPATSKPIEDSLTGANSQSYLNSDGTEATVFSSAPINFKSADGHWMPIKDATKQQVAAGTTPPVDPSKLATSLTVQDGKGSTKDGDLLVGKAPGGDANSYLKFDLSSLKGHRIVGVGLFVVNYEAPSCRAKPLTVYPVTESWDDNYPGAAVGKALGSASFAHGYVGLGQTTSACPVASGDMINLGENGAKLVKQWADGKPNYGISLRATGADAWKKIAGLDSKNPPSLIVTHSPYNADYEIPDPSPKPAVLQNQAGTVKVTAINTGSAPWTAGSYYLAYRAFLNNKVVLQQRSADLKANVPVGGRVTFDAKIQPLAVGAYELQFSMVANGGKVFTDYQIPPGGLYLQVFNVPPVVQTYPQNGYQAPTLQPMLWADAADVDAKPGQKMSYTFEICDLVDGKETGCTKSPTSDAPGWLVPAGRLSWSKQYRWRVAVKDSKDTVRQGGDLTTSVPQPELTAQLGSAGGNPEHEFDPQTGNVTFSAVDATVSTAGPSLNLVRTYNSLDPRTDSAFGAGWSSRQDMRIVYDDKGQYETATVTYPDGQMVRFARNPDKSWAAPVGRAMQLTFTEQPKTWVLKDHGKTTYEFYGDNTGALKRIVDGWSRSIVMDTDPSTGHVKTTRSSGKNNRGLTFQWTGKHITAVSTDPVGGTPLTWNYVYDGDVLKKVCGPANQCTSYDYTPGSHFRSAVLDANPDSYWRLGESAGTGAGSDLAVNLGKDAGTATDITWGGDGVLAGSPNHSAGFTGKSTITLPAGTLKKSRDAALEIWFKVAGNQMVGPLVGYQDKPLGEKPTVGAPILYLGLDGALRGQFATGKVNPILAPKVVQDGKWHQAVLSAAGNTQTLYLDGVKQGELTGQDISHTKLTANQLGAAMAVNGPAGTWPQWGDQVQRNFTGQLDEVSLYAHPLSAETVATHYKLATTTSPQLSTVTLPSGKVTAEAVYDTDTDRVREYTDDNGGTWKIGKPAVFGDDKDLRRSIQLRDEANQPYLYEYDALTNRLLRSGTPLGLEAKPDPTPPPATPSPSPTVTCGPHDPGDPEFCTSNPGGTNGPPIFVKHRLDGLAVRAYDYNEQGQLVRTTSETGATVSMTYDAKGNMASRTTCRVELGQRPDGTPGDPLPTDKHSCQTTWNEYGTGRTDPLDPLTNMVTATRDPRSKDATDNTYVTRFTYFDNGEQRAQTNPDGRMTESLYTVGQRLAVDGGPEPSGMLESTRDARGKLTTLHYYANGDVARVTSPGGGKTEFTYDELGRKTSQKEISTSFPDGVVTTVSYDAFSRPTVVTGTVTVNAVDGSKHQLQTVNQYDVDGHPIAVTEKDLQQPDLPERVTRTEYDDFGNPVSVVDPEGGETTFGYDLSGNKTFQQDPLGNRTEFRYTARNKLAEVRLKDWTGDPAGAPATGAGGDLILHSYSYDYAGRLFSDTDAMGRRMQYEYYDDDRLHTVTQLYRAPGAKETSKFVIEENIYDAAGHLTTKTAANGKRVTNREYDNVGMVTRSEDQPGSGGVYSRFNYDANGHVTETLSGQNYSNLPWWQETELGTNVLFTYDDEGHVLAETALGEKTKDGQLFRKTSYTYDTAGRRLTMTSPLGNVTGVDAATKTRFTTSYRYDELGRQIGVTGPEVAAESAGKDPVNARATITVGYDAFGDQTASKDPLGNISRTEYDRVGRPVRSIAPTYTPPGSDQAVTPTTSTSYDAAGNVTQSVDSRGNVSKFSYDQLGRVIRKDLPGRDNDQRAVWQYTYTRTGKVLSVTDPLGARTQSTYDEFDRPVTVTQVERRPDADNYTTVMSYDDVGNLISSTSPDGDTTINSYDSIGQLIMSKAPDGVVTTFGYDSRGHQVRVSDGAKRTVRTSYDAFNNARYTASLDGTDDYNSLRSTKMAYDEAGNLISSKDPYGKETTYAYNPLGQLTKQVEPVADGKTITTTFGYDVAGNRTRYTDGRGNTTNYSVNAWGMPESVVEPSTTSNPAPADRTWTVGYDIAGQATRLTAPGGVQRNRGYDAAGRLTFESGTGAEAATTERHLGYDLDGRLTSLTTPKGTNTYGYNDRGALLSAAGPSGTASFDYTRSGQLASRTDLAGTATFEYSKARLAAVTDGSTGVRQKLSYDAAGALKTVDYGQGRVRSYAYDKLNRLASDTLVNADKTVVTSAAYEYDLNDHVTRKTDTGTAGAGDNTYTYDQIGRLTGWTGPKGSTAYAWDDSGNRIKAGDKTATFDERNRLLSDGDYTYQYSARGTLKSRTSSGLVEPYSFDAFDRMVTANGQSYGYDSLDRVATRGDNQFSYAGLSKEPVSDSVDVYARGPMDELLAITEGDKKQLMISDRHDDVVAAIDPADSKLAGLSASKTYDPFGKPVASAGSTGQIGFQGDWTDPNNGQVNMGARWYNPSSGSFLSRDSVNYSSGNSVLANRYAYGADAPLDMTDPDGHWPGWVDNAWHAVTSAANTVVNTVSNAVGAAYDWGRSALRTVGNAIGSAVSWLSEKASQAYNWVADKVSSGYNAVAAGFNWARQQVVKTAEQVYQEAKQVTQRARAAIANTVKHTVLPVLDAVTKPLMTGLKTVVSASSKVAAAVVATTKQAIRDVKAFSEDLYKTAVKTAGVMVEGVSRAASAVGQFYHDHKAEIWGAVAGIAVGIGCGVAIGWTGVGAVGCAALAGAVGSAVTGYMEGERGLKLLTSAGIGAATGVIGLGLGVLGGKAIQYGGRALVGAFTKGGAAAAREGATVASAEVAQSSRAVVDDLLPKANALRDDEVARLAAGPAKLRSEHSVVVGAFNVRTGNVAVGVSSKVLSECAEACAARNVGGALKDIRFTRALRPRGSGRPPTDQPVCATYCEPTYGRGAFPDPATRYQSDGH